MTRLVVLNGPPASGKSTTARRYIAEHPLALCLDVDAVRGLLGRWTEEPTAAGLAARRLALAMAREHLAAGHDVVVPQLVARGPFVDDLAGVAGRAGAGFHEVVLDVDEGQMLRRFAARRHAGRPGNGDTAWLVERDGGESHLRALRAALEAFVEGRPSAVRVPSSDGDPERTYRDVLAVLT
jgi:predicted kinase